MKYCFLISSFNSLSLQCKCHRFCSDQQWEIRVQYTYQLFPMHSPSNSRNFLFSVGIDAMYSDNENGIELSGTTGPAVIFGVPLSSLVFLTAGGSESLEANMSRMLRCLLPEAVAVDAADCCDEAGVASGAFSTRFSSVMVLCTRRVVRDRVWVRSEV